MNGTGIFATKEELKLLKQAVLRGWQHGEAAIVLSVQMGMEIENE